VSRDSTGAEDVLRRSRSVLLVDWPSQDVPETLVRAGLAVFVKGGPGPRDFAARELDGDEVVSRPVDRPPNQIDLVYAYRPLDELPAIVQLARQVGAFAVWRQTGLSADESAESRKIVAAAGMAYVDEVEIADAARSLGSSQ
jgi:predicted CoA-binding protein